MVTSRHLSEAHAAERRRVVNAFAHGSRGALDPAPAHGGGALVSGLLLAGLLAGGAALLRVVEHPPTEPVVPVPGPHEVR